MIRRRILLLLAPLVGVAAGVLPAPLVGQSLDLAELFIEQGRLDDARTEVDAWFEIRGSAATPRQIQHGLWLQGRLLPDRARARARLEQLVASYPEGPYTARALNWLADFAEQAGEMEAAVAYQRQVVRDFPATPAAAVARDWLDVRGVGVDAEIRVAAADPVSVADSAAPPRAPAADSLPPAAAVPLPTDSAAAGAAAAPVAARDSVAAGAVAAERPAPPVRADSAAAEEAAAPAAARTDSAAAAPEVPEAARGAPFPGAATGGAWAVQIGAFRNRVGAGGLVDELVAAGFDARLVGLPASALYRVRVGRFDDATAAEAALSRLRAAGHDGAVVSDARRELAVAR